MRARLLLTVLGVVVITTFMGGAASALTGKQPLVIVLCKFTDQTNEPHPVDYYQKMFSETGAGLHGVFDFWRDVSYGNLDLTGTVVKGWYTANTTVAQFNVMNRSDQINVCATPADNDVDFSKFAGVFVLTNHTNLNGPLFGGEPPTPINGTTYTSLGRGAAEEDQQLNGILHETGHSLAVRHSRAITNNPSQQSDYGDLYDVQSCLGCYGTTTFSYQGSGGPGMNAVQIASSGWFPPLRVLDINSNTCTQQTVQLAALNHPEAVGFLAVRMPAAVPIFGGSSIATTGDAYVLELRHPSGWDSGIGLSGVLVHLHGQDGYSYWVDQPGTWGTYPGGGALMIEGDAYIDAAKQNLYVAVNSIDDTAHTAVVTVGTRAPNGQGDCKLDASLSYSGDTTGDFNDLVKLTADLRPSGSTAPVPGVTVNFQVGTQTCAATADENGRAACSLRLNQHPGAYNVTASFAGDAAWDSASASAGFTITREESKVTYDGSLTSDYHDVFTASSTLVDPVDGVAIAGKSIVFTLGASDTCTAVTNSSGVASCSIIPNQAAGAYSITASFAGDVDYEPSSGAKSFIVTREQTTTTYTGPLVILQGQSVSLTGRLLEDGVTPIQGRTLTLKLGSQNCTAVTNASGDAACSLLVSVALGTQALSAEFSGDAFYLPSSDSGKKSIVFAFPARGAFVLGNQTAAEPASSVTWWSHSWTATNGLAGGDPVNSFKGFADSLSTSPPVCGSTWTTSPANSPPPVNSVPAYMGVLVATSIAKNGSIFSGNTVKIVVVQTLPGYEPDSGHPGMGTIVATYCP